MIDHVGLFVRDYQRSKAFYRQMLQPLGYELLGEMDPAPTAGSDPARDTALGRIAMFGPPGPGRPFQITASHHQTGPAHVALRCPSPEVVDAMYRAGLDAGGRDNGEPGPRSFMPANYYGAFVLDPDGNEIEPLCWRGVASPPSSGPAVATPPAEGGSPLERNKALVVRFYRTIEQPGASTDALDEFVAADFVNYGVPPGYSADRQGLKQFFTSLRAGFPDGQTEFLHVVAEGDMVMAHKVNHGTHLGEFMGMAPTGRRVHTESVKMFRIADGKIVAHWHVVDVLGLMHQIGVRPAMHTP